MTCVPICRPPVVRYNWQLGLTRPLPPTRIPRPEHECCYYLGNHFVDMGRKPRTTGCKTCLKRRIKVRGKHLPLRWSSRANASISVIEESRNASTAFAAGGSAMATLLGFSSMRKPSTLLNPDRHHRRRHPQNLYLPLVPSQVLNLQLCRTW